MTRSRDVSPPYRVSDPNDLYANNKNINFLKWKIVCIFAICTKRIVFMVAMHYRDKLLNVASQ